MDARTVELGAAARGHAPPSDRLRQGLAEQTGAFDAVWIRYPAQGSA